MCTAAKAKDEDNDIKSRFSVELAKALEIIRKKGSLPSLAGAIFTGDGIVGIAATGVRKQGLSAPVTVADQWHIGSNCKTMTAALAGIFVNEGNLSWDKKILDLMPDLISDVSPGFELVTIGDLLSHRAGLPENLCWREISQRGSVLDQRRSSIRLALKNPPYSLGEFQYSNTGYVLIASILEHISGKSWEMLIQDRLLRPLGMRSAGFGGVGIHGIVDQPWSHLDNGQPSPINGPLMDNPPILAPAGGIHCSMTDWIKFLSDQLRGARCMTALLSRNIYSAMQAPVDDGTYGYGWLVVERSWASGIALTHSGSNTVNYAVCWLAPKMNFGFVVCCNQGGDTARKHCDLAGSIMIILYNQLINPPKASA